MPCGLPWWRWDVLPKPLPMNRGALWTLFLTSGLLMGLFACAIVEGPSDVDLGSTSGKQSVAAAADDPEAQPTMEVHVRAVLELPSPTPTNTPKPSPTATAGAASMDRLTPGDWCVWPTEPAGTDDWASTGNR